MIHNIPDENEAPVPSSDRSFGIVMFSACLIIALHPLISDNKPYWWLLAIGAVFLLLALAKPDILRPLNCVWTRFGLLLGKVGNPIVLGLMYFIIISPVAIGMKLAGRDPLLRKFEPDLETYWQDRDPAGPTPESMKNQY
jgi:hypothetical protein